MLGKLLIGVALTIVVGVGGPYALAHLGLIPPLNDKAWLILMVTVGGLVIKTLIGDSVSGEFLWYKFGYDNCIMAFGSILTSAALQLVTQTDLFPGMNSVLLLKDFPDSVANPAGKRAAQLFGVLVIALVLTLLTARIAAAIKSKKTGQPDFLGFVNAVIGTALLGVYILILVTKG